MQVEAPADEGGAGAGEEVIDLTGLDDGAAEPQQQQRQQAQQQQQQGQDEEVIDLTDD